MKLSQLLSPAQIRVDYAAKDKWDALAAMAELFVEVGVLPAARQEEAQQALVTRERSMTTGMENGIAIPHASMEALPGPLACLLLSPEGVPFEAIDRQPGQFLVGLLIPREEKLLHIRTLAEIARLLSRAEVRRDLIGCGSPETALEAIRAAE